MRGQCPIPVQPINGRGPAGFRTKSPAGERDILFFCAGGAPVLLPPATVGAGLTAQNQSAIHRISFDRYSSQFLR